MSSPETIQFGNVMEFTVMDAKSTEIIVRASPLVKGSMSTPVVNPLIGCIVEDKNYSTPYQQKIVQLQCIETVERPFEIDRRDEM
jgi:hypothetical protein